MKVSVIIPTLNDEENLEKCLDFLSKQNFDKNSWEIIVIDGGSTDKTLKVAQKGKVKILEDKIGSPEVAKGLGIVQAKGEYILIMDADDFLIDKNYVRRLLTSLEKEKNCIGAYSESYFWGKEDKILNRYFALIGGNDPLAVFLGKNDRRGFIQKNTDLYGKIIKDTDKFLIRQFDVNKVPTLGGNGFLVKKEMLEKSKFKKEIFFHSDAIYNLVFKGFDKFLVYKTEVWHASGEEFIYYFVKRYKYLNDIYMRDFRKRDYHVFDPKKDLVKLTLFCLSSMTLLYPIYFSIKGFLKKKDVAWFLHPLVCTGIFWVYSFSVIKNLFNQRKV